MIGLPRRDVWLSGAFVCLAAFAGCHSMKLLPAPDDGDWQQAATPPGKYVPRAGHFVFHADWELSMNSPLFRELGQLGDQVYRDLKLPEGNTLVYVYLFEDRERYENFLQARYPELPKRRAYFIAQPQKNGGEQLQVYTYWGPRVSEDLRHELTHALLHSVLKDVPLWLDEGLAEYYELPPAQHGVNSHHVAQLRKRAGPGKFNLARLEKLDKVSQMNPPEYRESWAWVHLMLHSTPEAKAALLGYLQKLRTTKDPGPLRPALAGVFDDPEGALEAHLEEMLKGKRLTSTSFR